VPAAAAAIGRTVRVKVIFSLLDWGVWGKAAEWINVRMVFVA
jgi:hypothetical protein